MTERYEDMIGMERPVSRRAKMSPINRAAQFAPFAALTGYDAAIRETGRLTEQRRELDENEKEQLNRQLQFLAGHLGNRPRIAVTYFCPDARKTGGAYVTFTGLLEKIDPYRGCLSFSDGTQILIEDICQILDGSCVDI